MEAHAIPLLKLYETVNKAYVIPIYQRPFAWDSRKAEDLLDDHVAWHAIVLQHSRRESLRQQHPRNDRSFDHVGDCRRAAAFDRLRNHRARSQ